MGTLLALHLGAVLSLFLTLPSGKFAHGLYRYGALLLHARERRAGRAFGGAAADPAVAPVAEEDAAGSASRRPSPGSAAPPIRRRVLSVPSRARGRPPPRSRARR